MANISSYFSISAIFIFTLCTSPSNLCLASRKFLSSETYTEFIKASCDKTIYQDLCFATFSSYANEIKGSTKVLATKSLFVTLNSTRSALKTLKKISKKQGLKPREVAAIQDCVEEMSDAVDEVKRSIAEMDETTGKSFEFRMSDIQTWVSASMSDENSCTDGFSETAMDGDGDVEANVRDVIEKVEHFTSISLSFINRYAGNKI